MNNQASDYTRARATWKRFRAGVAGQPVVLDELLTALRLILNEYSTTLRENRFLVGGAAERLVAIAMRAVGLRSTRARGLRWDEEDLVVDGCQISLKCVFAPRLSTIRLINALGSGADAIWTAPTIFLLAGRGMGYADSELLQDAVVPTGDALLLDAHRLLAFLESNPEYWMKCDVPTKPTDPQSIRAASELVVREVLQRRNDPQFPHLRAHM